jgi:hypothetical protein
MIFFYVLSTLHLRISVYMYIGAACFSVLLTTFNIGLVICRYFQLLNCMNLHFDNCLKNNLFNVYCDLAFEQIQQVYPM